MIKKMVVGGLMTKPVATCRPETSLRELVETLTSAGVSCAVVLSQGKPVGIVTERDVVRLFHRALQGDSTLPEKPASDFMTVAPVTVQAHTSLFDALVLTRTVGIRHLPVVDDVGLLIGMLTFSDLARAYEQIVSTQRKVMEEEVDSKTRHLEEINEHLVTLSLRDPLLGIGNRRAMEVDLDYSHKAAVAKKSNYAVVLFDVDYFKHYNDRYGHQAGDEALQRVVRSIESSIRNTDRLYRYGGEEILLLMMGSSLPKAAEIARRSARSLQQKGYEHAQSPQGVLTISGGVASLRNCPAETWRDVVALADHALYAAKKSGRNQIVVCDASEMPSPSGVL